MTTSTYKSVGQTPKDAFNGIWELMQYTDDFILRKVKEGWEIKLTVRKPTKKEMLNIENKEIL